VLCGYGIAGGHTQEQEARDTDEHRSPRHAMHAKPSRAAPSRTSPRCHCGSPPNPRNPPVPSLSHRTRRRSPLARARSLCHVAVTSRGPFAAVVLWFGVGAVGWPSIFARHYKQVLRFSEFDILVV